jgi:hypothetical protein
LVVPEFGTRAAGTGWRFYVAESGGWEELDARHVVDAWPS